MTARKPLVFVGGQFKQLPAGDLLQLLAAVAGVASMNVPHGATPTSPVNGDIWTTTAGLFARINGVTIGPFGIGTGYTDAQAQAAVGSILTGISYDGAGPNIAAIRVAQVQVTAPGGSALTTGDDQAFFRINAQLSGYKLTAVAAYVSTVSSSGLPTIQVRNATTGFDMLSTALTIDANENDSSTAATPAVIDASHNSVSTADSIRIDIDVAGTGAKGLIVELTFTLP